KGEPRVEREPLGAQALLPGEPAVDQIVIDVGHAEIGGRGRAPAPLLKAGLDGEKAAARVMPERDASFEEHRPARGVAGRDDPGGAGGVEGEDVLVPAVKAE